MIEKGMSLFLSFKEVATRQEMEEAKMILNTLGYYALQDFMYEIINKVAK